MLICAPHASLQMILPTLSNHIHSVPIGGIVMLISSPMLQRKRVRRHDAGAGQAGRNRKESCCYAIKITR